MPIKMDEKRDFQMNEIRWIPINLNNYVQVLWMWYECGMNVEWMSCDVMVFHVFYSICIAKLIQQN